MSRSAKGATLLVYAALLCAVVTVPATADMPPRAGTAWSQGYLERAAMGAGPYGVEPFTFSRSYLQLTLAVRSNRQSVQAGTMSLADAAAVGGTVITGSKSIPVLMSKFNNTGADPYPVGDLQQELFDGPWPTGTMADFYEEISYGVFTVNGTVFPWGTLPDDDTDYEGPSGCNGLCAQSGFGDFLTQTLDANDATVDFSLYDNDGVDGVANSGDDDGYVDFVAFVHPESGGECGNDNIWSHRWVYGGWTGSDYETNDPGASGNPIRISDYVVQPGFSCDGTTMIEIGVFAHEFAHAFGLPDLYDTDPSNGDSEGIGNWGLMAGGSWGGDGQSPEMPAHMSAWSKEFLGWINPTEVTADTDPASLADIENNAFSFKIPISGNRYYLVSNRQQMGFDQNLPASGMLIWRIDENVISATMGTNRVNADENNKGVGLIEADGANDLDNSANRGDAGDPFPGSTNKRQFDNSSNPASTGTISICNISDPTNPMTAAINVTTGSCDGAGGGCGGLFSMIGPPGINSAGPGAPGSGLQRSTGQGSRAQGLVNLALATAPLVLAMLVGLTCLAHRRYRPGARP